MSVPLSDTHITPVRPSRNEWSPFRGAHPNALLIGSKASALNAAISHLLPLLRAPVVHWHPRAVKEPPRQTAGTLLIWDVDTLDRMQQEQLCMWMESPASNVQMISVAERPVFPLVLREEFLDTLYYRLNIAHLQVATSYLARHHVERLRQPPNLIAAARPYLLVILSA